MSELKFRACSMCGGGVLQGTKEEIEDQYRKDYVELGGDKEKADGFVFTWDTDQMRMYVVAEGLEDFVLVDLNEYKAFSLCNGPHYEGTRDGIEHGVIERFKLTNPDKDFREIQFYWMYDKEVLVVHRPGYMFSEDYCLIIS